MGRPAVLLCVLAGGALVWLLWPSGPPLPATLDGCGSAPKEASPQGASPKGASPIQLEGQAPHVPRTRIEAEADARAAAGHAVASPEVASRDAAPVRTVTVHGLLVEDDGLPVVDGWVRWRALGPKGGFLGAKTIGVDRDGRFRIAVAAADEIHLEASSSRSLRTSFTRPLNADGELGTLRLDPGLAIAGRLVAKGRREPFDSVIVQATRCDIDDAWATDADSATAEALRDMTAREALRRPAEDGFYGGAGPDSEGRWSIAPLRPGTYLVEVDVVGGGWLHRGIQAAHRQVVRAPDENVRFELACSVTHVVPDHPELHDGSQELMVSFTDAAGRTSEVEAWYKREWQGPGSFSMALAPGATYQLRVWANGYEQLVLDHVAPPAGEEVYVPVRLVPLPQGRLRIEPPLGRETSSPQVLVELLDRETGERVHWEHATLSGKGGWALSLCRGAWTLVISPWEAPAALGTQFDLPESRPIVIAADAEQTIRWTPPQGGRFSLHVDAGAGSPRALACLVERSGTKTRPTVVEWSAGRDTRVGWSDELATGSTYIALDAYPPGEIMLLLTAQGFRPLRLPVRIVRGEVTAVRATLAPR